MDAAMGHKGPLHREEREAAVATRNRPSAERVRSRAEQFGGLPVQGPGSDPRSFEQYESPDACFLYVIPRNIEAFGFVGIPRSRGRADLTGAHQTGMLAIGLIAWGSFHFLWRTLASYSL